MKLLSFHVSSSVFAKFNFGRDHCVEKRKKLQFSQKL